ncbi:sulfite exporter TauE/SafE family protein [Paenibacillus chondroitinus]|uniref:Probable membrane transporter protein n=1 Tax=Paenibacillus chondroitinus TaxID=59842 RepID=A0ABU6D835_9BACL|nr:MULTISPECIES: sulfite exporter TauE/SafE family protein [Paenibacillus]MCY9660058.1 sulfite exporter TauE/SafE family protein [Paenibacillus anseongense]MEB4793083.1 sulfite exporter TauE/SafE family protein [Paenibacillus chondroitinus]
MFELTYLQIVILIFAGIFVGFAKTGISTMGIFNAMLLTIIFPTKMSVGILLPMLIIGDIIAVAYYRKKVIKNHLISLMPWALIGVIGGYVVLLKVDNNQLKLLLGALICGLILLQLLRDFMGARFDSKFPSSMWFIASMGILAGFATTIGNVSGAIIAIYLFAKQVPKQEFIGTGAWFFLLVNLVKVPFFIHLGMITSDSLLIGIWTLPLIAIGAYAGIKLLPLIPQVYFQRLVLLLGAFGALKLLAEGIVIN